ncbi:hypothetical protein PGTUg99_019185 [Puccinia graminis f. sp. tritici]|uniref:Uncharacterized protein n=1 Tax=Puccinia graminis f. sp. tritici TaxID=56615 RepID=A0A5B0NCF3_PUCGR|nr:hypothetical protein PGTUg99_019185 [Puccinia graminis f. sp. tritici]
MSSAVTPSDSACHPSDACRSRYSSGRSWTGLSPPLPPLVRSKPRFHPSVPPLLVAPPQYTLNHRSAVVREPWCPPVPGFPAASFSEPCAFACVRSVSSACFPHQPQAFRMPPNNLVKARSRHHSTKN